MKKIQAEYPEQEPDADTSESEGPQSLRKDKRGAAARSRALHRKGNTQGGMHERGNKKVKW